jgi:DnaK suppressor protein
VARPAMNKKDREKFIRLILEERRRKLDVLGRHQGTLDEIKGTRAAEYEEEVTLSDDKEYLSKLIEQQTRGLEEINHALEKVLDGTYGLCERCRKPINRERLEAIPTAILCLDCKRQEEEEGIVGWQRRQERVQRINLPGEDEGDREDLTIGADEE